MDWVFDRLALGAQEDGERATWPTVTVCLHVGQTPYTPQPGIYLLHVPIIDEVFLSAYTWSGLVFALGGFLRRNERVLVHCRLGKSRSPALVCAYLMHCGMSAGEAFLIVGERHPGTQIHPETMRSVIAWHTGGRTPCAR